MIILNWDPRPNLFVLSTTLVEAIDPPAPRVSCQLAWDSFWKSTAFFRAGQGISETMRTGSGRKSRRGRAPFQRDGTTAEGAATSSDLNAFINSSIRYLLM